MCEHCGDTGHVWLGDPGRRELYPCTCQSSVPHLPAIAAFDLVAHLHRQRAFSGKTFGPGDRLAGVLDHITKEIGEVRKAPRDIFEWVDLILLALDGAWRQGFTPEEIAAAIEAKQTKNEGRTWPDWRDMPADKAIEHVRSDEGGGP